MSVASLDPGPPPAGDLLRIWRTRRRMSQLELSSVSGVSTRHLSFVETGRSRASRELILHLAAVLDVPLRERNALLLGAGFAPAFPETPLEAPAMGNVREAVEGVLRAHEPFPALVMNRRFDLVEANASIALLVDGAADHLLEPPVNVMRATLHPDGLAPRIVNLAEYREHLLHTVHRELSATGDAYLARLLDELRAYPVPPGPASRSRHPGVLPLRLRSDAGELAFFSLYATFGTPRDIAVADLLIESLFPADEHTRDVLTRHAR